MKLNERVYKAIVKSFISWYNYEEISEDQKTWLYDNTLMSDYDSPGGYYAANGYIDSEGNLTDLGRELIEAGENPSVGTLEKAAEAEKAEYMKTSAAGYVQDFLNGIAASANTPAISTGFENLDAALDGGLYEGLYVLGAITSLGKTTLALQIADQIAQGGHDVLIFSLEMSRRELMAKSISRLTFKLQDSISRNKTVRAKSVRDITDGARYAHYNDEEKKLINKAVMEYQSFAQHIFIHEGVGDIGVQQIKEIVQRHISFTGNVPVIIVDYIQILAPYDVRRTDKQNTDKAILELKRLSRDYKMTVIGISSFNRDGYKIGSSTRGRVSMTDFKESGAVEYSADVLMGLEFASAGTKEYDEKEEKRKMPREVRLVVLKNRNGAAYCDARFAYFQHYNLYIGSVWRPANVNTDDIPKKFLYPDDSTDGPADIIG